MTDLNKLLQGVIVGKFYKVTSDIDKEEAERIDIAYAKLTTKTEIKLLITFNK